jgi:hypothetical protein
MTRCELDHTTFHGLNAVKDFERGIVEATTAQDALLIVQRIHQVLAEFQAADLLAHNRVDVLSGLKERHA